MKIAVLGTGCPKCARLAESAEIAARELGVEYELEKVTDINKIIGYGVMMTPALAIDGKVVAAGKALSVEDAKRLLAEKAEFENRPRHLFPGQCAADG